MARTSIRKTLQSLLIATAISTFPSFLSQAEEKCLASKYSVTINGEKIDYDTSVQEKPSTSIFTSYIHEFQTLKVKKKDGAKFSISTEVCYTQNPFQCYKSYFKITGVDIINDGQTNHFGPDNPDWAGSSLKASATLDQYVKSINQDITIKREKALESLKK